jgi:hypothetical protein
MAGGNVLSYMLTTTAGKERSMRLSLRTCTDQEAVRDNLIQWRPLGGVIHLGTSGSRVRTAQCMHVLASTKCSR